MTDYPESDAEDRRRKARVAKLSRDVMRDRMHDAFEEYAKTASAAVETLVAARKKVIGQLIEADDWLESRGVDINDVNVETLTWPEELDPTLSIVDFGTEFDEQSANAEEALDKKRRNARLIEQIFVENEDES